jgi:steroid 5-alpha reductase family enzyme
MTHALLALLIFFHLMFLLAIKLKDNSIVDIGWGMGFVLLDIVLLANSTSLSVPQICASMLILAWGIRLSGYILWRKIGKAEDFRYAAWRSSWGKSFLWRSYLQIFILQMLLLIIIATPLFLLAYGDYTLNAFTFIGSTLAILGLALETLSDWQMHVFKQSAKGGIMKEGLWRYSRHPNYFGEALFWWGIAIIAYLPNNYALEVISPLIITILVRYISGVPMLEEKYKNNAEFKSYAAKTSVFIPWLPKK